MAAEPQRILSLFSPPALQGEPDLGPYQLLEDLGPAPFGNAYLAADFRNGRTVCLKVVSRSRQGLWQAATPWEILLAETEALERIYHRGIPQVLEIAEYDGCLVVAFQAAEGRSLQELLARGERLDRETLIDWGGQLLDILAEAHQQGILHRHVGEEAVVVREDGTLFLTGFGLTQLSFARAGEAAGDLYTPQSDLHAAGALLRRLSFASALRRRGGLEARDPLLKVLARATCPEESARFESAGEMAEALREAGRAGGVAPSRRPGRSGSVAEGQPAGRLRLLDASPRFSPPVRPPKAGGEGELWRSVVLLAASLLLLSFFLTTGWFLFSRDLPASPGNPVSDQDVRQKKNPGSDFARVGPSHH